MSSSSSSSCHCWFCRGFLSSCLEDHSPPREWPSQPEQQWRWLRPHPERHLAEEQNDDKTKGQTLISVKFASFSLKWQFHFEMHKTTDFHSNLLVSGNWWLKAIKEDVWSTHFTHWKTLTKYSISLVLTLLHQAHEAWMCCSNFSDFSSILFHFPLFFPKFLKGILHTQKYI